MQYAGPWGQAALRLRRVPNARGWYASLYVPYGGPGCYSRTRVGLGSDLAVDHHALHRELFGPPHIPPLERDTLASGLVRVRARARSRVTMRARARARVRVRVRISVRAP